MPPGKSEEGTKNTERAHMVGRDFQRRGVSSTSEPEAEEEGRQ